MTTMVSVSMEGLREACQLLADGDMLGSRDALLELVGKAEFAHDAIPISYSPPPSERVSAKQEKPMSDSSDVDPDAELSPKARETLNAVRRASDGITVRELMVALDSSMNAVRPQLRELEQAGRVVSKPIPRSSVKLYKVASTS